MTKNLVPCDCVVAVDRSVGQHVIVQIGDEVLEFGAADEDLYFSSELGPSVVATGESSFIFLYSSHQGDVCRTRQSVKIEEAVWGFLEDTCSSIRFVDGEFVSSLTVVRDTVFLLHVGEGDNIRNAIGMEPHCSVSREIANKVRRCTPGLR